ncbi:hypothetical protein OAS39_11080, partial [Pirellulales bacterium]|nr:hypothetical protein [Pirellulales bacterium]
MSAMQQRPWYSFRWRILLWIAIPFIWIGVADYVAVYMISSRTEQGQVVSAGEGAVRWLPYTAKKKAECLTSGKHLFVFVHAEMNQASPFALKCLDASNLANIAGNNEYLTLIHK